MLGGMDSSTGGKIIVDGKKISSMKNRELIQYRRHDIGFVFQFYNLVANLTALENVELACQLCKDAFEPVEVMIEVGLKKRLDSFPSQLSGGEQQRVAIARAIAKNPKILLCDEPTGALDSKTGIDIMNLLEELNNNGQTIILITHDMNIAKRAKRIVRISDGKLYEEEENDKVQEHSQRVNKKHSQ
jgi:putative ABC transport system ATP-binding protein